MFEENGFKILSRRIREIAFSPSEDDSNDFYQPELARTQALYKERFLVVLALRRYIALGRGGDHGRVLWMVKVPDSSRR